MCQIPFSGQWVQQLTKQTQTPALVELHRGDGTNTSHRKRCLGAGKKDKGDEGGRGAEGMEGGKGCNFKASFWKCH